jgi:hypothetical protein
MTRTQSFGNWICVNVKVSRSSFRNFVFSSYLEYRTMDKGHKPSDSESSACCLLFDPKMRQYVPPKLDVFLPDYAAAHSRR